MPNSIHGVLEMLCLIAIEVVDELTDKREVTASILWVAAAPR